jgi:uncharacterized protein DUF6916
MNVTRRKFLRAGAVSALFAGLTLGPSKLTFGQKKHKNAPPFPPPDSDPVFSFNAATFTPYVGTEFLLAAGARGRRMAARLELVSDLQQDMRDRQVATHGGECFALIFRASALKRAPGQDVYRVEHAALGRFSLFLVPGPARDGLVAYEAVINRLA